MARLTLLALLLVLAAPVAVLGQDGERVDVVDVSGPLDESAIRFLLETVENLERRGTNVAIVQLDVPAVVSAPARYDDLADVLGDPPIPLVVWIGPAPGRAYGGALELAASAPLTFAAPGVHVGYGTPMVIGGQPSTQPRVPADLADRSVVVSDVVEGVIDGVSPSIRQLIQALDGLTIEVRGESVELSTLVSVEGGEGDAVTTAPVVFHKPGYWTRFLRLATTPEAAYFFLLAGLTLAAFEFYAIGPGLASAVAAVSLFLGSYGIFALPMRWWAFGLAVLGWWALTVSYQMGSVATLTVTGAVALTVGGLWLVDGAPQLQMNVVVTLVIVAGVVAFYAVAMPTVARSRFSTRTIGRTHLVGSRGVAVGDLDPDGEVEVAGARWQASSHREARIRAGEEVRIVEVAGLVLEVERPGTLREAQSPRENDF
ncbi:hypothetical protein BH23ACT5_BH23ACT5_23140 [soil metagenome]